MSTVTNDRRSPHHNLLVNFHHSGYAAEQTIAMYSVPDAMVTERPLFEKMTEKFIPLTQLIVTLVSGLMTSTVV